MCGADNVSFLSVRRAREYSCSPCQEVSHIDPGSLHSRSMCIIEHDADGCPRQLCKANFVKMRVLTGTISTIARPRISEATEGFCWPRLGAD